MYAGRGLQLNEFLLNLLHLISGCYRVINPSLKRVACYKRLPLNKMFSTLLEIYSFRPALAIS